MAERGKPGGAGPRARQTAPSTGTSHSTYRTSRTQALDIGTSKDGFARGPKALVDAGLPQPGPIGWCARCGTPESACLGHYDRSAATESRLKPSQNEPSDSGAGDPFTGLKRDKK